MSGRVTVCLATPVEVTGGFASEFVFRPATYREFCTRGSPFDAVPVDGVMVSVTNHEKALTWAETLLVEPTDKSAIGRMTDPRDFAAVEAAMRGFLEAKTGATTPPPTPSSSAPDGPKPLLIG